LAILDLETIGTDVRDDRIVEIAILKMGTSVKPSLFHTLVNPGRLGRYAHPRDHGCTRGRSGKVQVIKWLCPVESPR
jgi:DNA polymerase III epsilon subunit-like protein